MADLSPDFTDAEPPAEFSRTPDSGAVVNRLCAVLSEEYGWLRFSTRTGAAVQAIRFVEARRDGGPDLPTRVASLEEELVSARSELDRLRDRAADLSCCLDEVGGERDRLRVQRDAVLATLDSSVSAGLQHVSIDAVRRALEVTE